MSLTLTSYIEGVKTKKFSPREVVTEYMQKVINEPYNAFVRTHDEYVEKNLDIFSSKSLCAAPIAIKDNIYTKGYETTSASKILAWYRPAYSATCFERLEAAGGLMLGKTNMDEFAMGSSSETSAFGPVLNPHDTSRVPGGSSGGSAVAVASDLCIAWFGTDTGWSVRQPASLCGVVGMKPTYGRISRYGVQALSSPLDQVGTFTKTVDDAALLLSLVCGKDAYDAHTQDRHDDIDTWLWNTASASMKWKKIAVPKEFFWQWIEQEVEMTCKNVLNKLEHAWAIVERIDMPVVAYGVPVYYILMPADASTNLARFDGVRFWLQESTESYDDIFKYYAAVREKGFGEEVKRRIFVGAYVLRSGFYDAFYRKALRVRAQLIRDLEKVFSTFDAIVGPTSPSVARKIGEKMDDPIAMYLADIYTVIANLAWTPAISVPVGTAERDGKHLPIGFQIMTKRRDEKGMFEIARGVEQLEMSK